jgi:formamidopyrimidine-DNA glycosylase
MPELPEVETTRRGIAPYLIGRRVDSLAIRQPRLRWPIPRALQKNLPGRRITSVERRAKYLLVHTEKGSALLHLGMSGSLRVLPGDAPAGPHDHVDWRLDSGRLLRYRPRRFGTSPATLRYIAPFSRPGPGRSRALDGAHPWKVAQPRRVIKTFPDGPNRRRRRQHLRASAVRRRQSPAGRFGSGV